MGASQKAQRREGSQPARDPARDPPGAAEASPDLVES
jgi:hypothetical protein